MIHEIERVGYKFPICAGSLETAARTNSFVASEANDRPISTGVQRKDGETETERAEANIRGEAVIFLY